MIKIYNFEELEKINYAGFFKACNNYRRESGYKEEGDESPSNEAIKKYTVSTGVCYADCEGNLFHLY